MNNPEDQFELCEQRHAILKGAGHMLVLGGPGSGKTTIALLKARRVVLERLKPEQSVLFVSFANAAIRRILESAGNIFTTEIEREIEIKTYHAFAWDLLRSHGYLLSSQRRLAIIPEQDTVVLGAGLNDEEWVAEENRLFVEDGRVTYDQFARRAAELLEQSEVVRGFFSYAHPLILVDEFQDTDEDQWRLVRAMAENSDIVALGDTEQRIYAWRKGVSVRRLQDFAETLNAVTFDFRDENNRSPATGIVGYARSLLSPEVRLDVPEDIAFKRFIPGQFPVGLRFALINTLKESIKRTGHREVTVAVAARSRTMVRLISDALAKKLTIGSKEHRPITHDVMFNQVQITLASRVIAYVLASQAESMNERLAGTLIRISAVFRSSGNNTGISKSDQLLKWAERCREGNVPSTKCVTALITAIGTVDAKGFSGAPMEDWLTVRRTLDEANADELKRIGGHARYLRLLRRGSAIEDRLSNLWKENGSYEGAEASLEEAILQDQLIDNHREAFFISVMTMHQLKGREYDAVLLVEDRHRTFRGKDSTPPYMETRRLLQVSLTRARHYACILSQRGESTLDVIFDD